MTLMRCCKSKRLTSEELYLDPKFGECYKLDDE